MQTIQLRSWAEFEQRIREINKFREEREREFHPFNDPLFRGLGNSDWQLQTTLERAFPRERSHETLSLNRYYRKAVASKPAVVTLTGRRWDGVLDHWKFLEVIRQSPTAWLDFILLQNPAIVEYLIYLRHHGFPSPLLDWTASPYVAAFFAFDATDEQAENVSVHALVRDTSTSGSSDQHFFVIGRYLESHSRHYLQQGSYTMCVQMASDDYSFVPHQEAIEEVGGEKGEMFKIIIPAAERTTALKNLDLMNINAYSLFGSEDALIRSIARRECLFRPLDP